MPALWWPVKIFRDVGTNYAKVIVEPSYRSALRGATVKHASQDLYTASRSEIESDLEKSIRGQLHVAEQDAFAIDTVTIQDGSVHLESSLLYSLRKDSDVTH